MVARPVAPDGAAPRRDSRRAEILDAFTRAVAVRAPGSSATEDDVMAFVAERSAPYKRVRQLEFIDAVPKSASGKILRRELRLKEKEAAG